jgi:TIR domain
VSAADEYLTDSERAFATISARLKSDAKAGRPSDSNFDVFISHASEDKGAFVRPLVAELANRKVRVWYDETEVKIGNSLRRSIDAGLTKSRFGIVILSPRFFAKKWTQHELDGIIERDMNSKQFLLPVCYKMTHNDLVKISPTLADRVAIDSRRFSIAEIAEKLAKAVHET